MGVGQCLNHFNSRFSLKHAQVFVINNDDTITTVAFYKTTYEGLETISTSSNESG